MGAAQRLRHDLVNDAEFQQVFGGHAQGFGGFLGVGRAPPQDGRAAFRRNHRINRIFQHHHIVAGGQGDGPAGASLADNGDDDRHLGAEANLNGAGDGLGLAAFLGVDSGIGAGGVDEG